MAPTDKDLQEIERLMKELDFDEILVREGYNYLPGSYLDTERPSLNEVILAERLQNALIRLNPHISDTDLKNYLNTVLNIKELSPMEANKIFYEKIVYKSEWSDPRNQSEDKELKLIDFENSNNNEFLAVKEFIIKDAHRIIELDYVLFINGLPLVIIETKGLMRDLSSGKAQLKNSLENCEELFCYNQLMIVTNIAEVQVGLVPYTWNDIREWENFHADIYPEGPKKFEGITLSLDILTSMVFRKESLLALISRRIIYYQENGKIAKAFSFSSSSSANGEGAINDRVTTKDLLDRGNLIKELSNFYTEYSEQNSFPFYLGIFGRWGMGKSSVNEMVTKNILEYSSDEYEHLVLKIDCSLFHKKDKLWISILNDLLDLLSTKEVKKKVFGWKFRSFKMRFFHLNLISWLKDNWWSWSFLLPVISLIYLIIYCLYTSSFPKILKPKDFKEATAMLGIVTFVYGILKTGSLLIKQNLFLKDSRNENSTYVQSLKEFKQFTNLMNSSKKKKDIKILIIIDELDRIHKDLLPDIIELIQIFRGLNSGSFSEDEKEKKEQIKQNKVNKSVISFFFSFNHDFLFPVIGSNISLNDRQLLVSSYRKYKGFVEGTEKDAYVDYYKLGKEFMDKYLDLSIYLEEDIDYSRLVNELFYEVDNPINNIPLDNPLNAITNGYGVLTAHGTLSNGNSVSFKTGQSQQLTQEDIKAQSNKKNEFPSFNLWEIKIITNTINKHATKVEPRRIIRLKNALIMLKKLNKHTNSEIIGNSLYEIELERFIMDFLDVDFHPQKREVKQVYLKFTDYFIPSKN